MMKTPVELRLQFDSVESLLEFVNEGAAEAADAVEVEEQQPSPSRHRPITMTPLMCGTLDAIERSQPTTARLLGGRLKIAKETASQRLGALQNHQPSMVERIDGTWTWRLSPTAETRRWRSSLD